ncbi:hypothetical protein U9M48_028696, partial [Paspalum notatum var. saurae]
MIAKFAEYCRAHDKRPRKFTLDMKVRWNSTYHMLNSLESYEKIITVFVNANAKDLSLVLIDADWKIARQFRGFLMPFYAATNMLSGVYYPTTCLVIDYIWLMAELFSKYRSDSLLRTVVDPMELKFLKYFEQISHVYCFATIFDPRKKLDGLQTALEGIGDELDMDFSDALNHVKEELFNVFGYYYEKYGRERRGKSLLTHHQVKGSDRVLRGEKVNLLEWWRDHQYSSDRVLRGEKVKLLEWWRDHQYSFPVLACFARDILVISVSTVSSEATFSTVGRIIEGWRSSLAPETVEAITCLKDWKRAEER